MVMRKEQATASVFRRRWERTKRVFARTPGERAFDRCFFPLAIFFVGSVNLTAIEIVRQQRSGSNDTPHRALALLSPEWLPWTSLIVGVLFSFLWVRALFSVIRSWDDPSARILRKVSCILLVSFAAVTYSLLTGGFGALVSS